jgi:hypothetical protein
MAAIRGWLKNGRAQLGAETLENRGGEDNGGQQKYREGDRWKLWALVTGRVKSCQALKAF